MEYQYKFNVDSLDLEKVQEYLNERNRRGYRIVEHYSIEGVDADTWCALQTAKIEKGAREAGDHKRITDAAERSALIATDSDNFVDVEVESLPATMTRRLINRVAIHNGVNNAGVKRSDWRAILRTADCAYQVQFADKNDAIMFKLAMWKRPEDVMI